MVEDSLFNAIWEVLGEEVEWAANEGCTDPEGMIWERKQEVRDVLIPEILRIMNG